MSKRYKIDRTDARLLLALERHPSNCDGAGHNARAILIPSKPDLTGCKQLHGFGPLGASISPAVLGYPLTAFITVTVVQRMLSGVSDSLAAIPEIIEVFGVTTQALIIVSDGLKPPPGMRTRVPWCSKLGGFA
jgi:hypothetical protein